MGFKVLKVTGPAHWASYFINGDASGMYESEIPQADAFRTWCGGEIVDCAEETHFKKHHDATDFGVLACDCVEYTVHVGENFESALARFIATVQAHITDYITQNYRGLNVPRLETMRGPKYVRVITTAPGSRAVYCFIDISNGDVLKADGWKKPAKQPRGSIYAKDFSGYGVGIYGANYL